MGCILNRVTRMGSHIFGFRGLENSVTKYGSKMVSAKNFTKLL